MGDNSTQGSRAAAGLGESLAQSMRSTFEAGPQVFDRSMYAGIGDQTRGGISNAMDYANHASPGLLQAFDANRAIIGSDPADIMSTPGYAQVRQGVADSTLNDVGKMFSASNRFGGGGHVSTATQTLGNTLAGMDMGAYEANRARQERAIASTPGLAQSLQLPAQIQTAGGQLLDADRQAQLMGEADLFDRTANRQTNWQGQYLGMLGQLNGAPGTQEQTPWWQSALGYVAGNAGNAMRAFGG